MFTNKKQKNMKKLLVLLLIGLSFNGFSQQKKLTWYTDVKQATEVSIKTEKPMYLFFTGSDWCGWCKKLVREVFTKEEFKIWAEKNIVLVEIDFPRRENLKKLDQNTKNQNNELMQIFGPIYQQNTGRRMGFPTGFFVNPKVKDGKVDLVSEIIGIQGYVAGGPQVWIGTANRYLK